MYYIVSTFLIVMGLFFSTNVIAQNDRILARVNDDVVTLSDLEERLRPIIAKYESSYSGEELLENLVKAEKYWLNQLIENKLILQDADKQGIEISPEQLEERVERIKSDFESEIQFKVFLESQGMNIDQLKKSVEENMKIGISTMRIREKARYKISPKGVALYYEEHKKSFKEDGMVRASHILIRHKDNDSVTKKIAEEIHLKIKNGGDFAVLAREYSDGPHAQEGGDLGFFVSGQHISEIDNEIKKLKVGDLSGLFKSRLGYHILLVKQRKKARVKPFSEAQEEIENIILREKAKEIWDKWITKLKEKAFIEIYENP